VAWSDEAGWEIERRQTVGYQHLPVFKVNHGVRIRGVVTEVLWLEGEGVEDRATVCEVQRREIERD
jgi:hypothetical protein